MQSECIIPDLLFPMFAYVILDESKKRNDVLLSPGLAWGNLDERLADLLDQNDASGPRGA